MPFADVLGAGRPGGRPRGVASAGPFELPGDGPAGRRGGRSGRAPRGPGSTDGRRPSTPPSKSGEHLLVQAGTGTGKSLAYLVPAVAHAVATGRRWWSRPRRWRCRRRSSTATCRAVADALEPLLGRRVDLRAWSRAAATTCAGTSWSAASRTTRRTTLFGGAASPGPARRPSSATRCVRLREWADETASGDRDELVPGVSERAWRQVSVSAHECLGAQVPDVGRLLRRAGARARAATPTWSSPTTRCWPSTPSRAARSCPSTTSWSSTRATSWSTASPRRSPTS